MKKVKWLMLAAPLTLTLGTLPVALTACNSKQVETDKTPTITDVKEKTSYYMQFKKQTDGSYKYVAYGVQKPGQETYYPTIKITYFNNENIPYVDLDEYINDITNFYCRTAQGMTIINSLYNDEWCLIDYKKQTISFSDWDGFMNYNETNYGPLTQGAGGGENYYHSVKQTKYYRGVNHTIDLSYYNIKAYINKDEGTGNMHGFLPFELVRNLFNIEVFMTCDWNGQSMYQIVGGNDSIALEAKKQVRESSSIYDKKDYRNYCFNLLALTLDTRFGLLQRESRTVKGQTIRYMYKGAYDMLYKYYDGLMSNEDNVRNETLMKIFTTELDDGGHARYRNLDAFSTKNYATDAEKGDQTKHTFAISGAVEAKREALNQDIYSLSGTKKSDGIACGFVQTISGTQENGNIAYITFDSFKSENKPNAAAPYGWNAKEIEAGRELPASNGGSTAANNHFSDAMRLTMYANDIIKDKNNNIKNVVIDLSNNGGGTVYTEHFIASWLLGGVTEKIYNPTTGAYCEYEVKADVNGDGVFDSNDYIKDVNLYVITNSSSFSCGNMLPCNIVDGAKQRTGKTILWGTKSGGGACFVDDGMHLGCSTYFRSSSTFHMLRDASSYGNYVTVDTGAEITKGWEMDDTKPELFVDRNAIYSRIWNNK